MNDSDSNNVHIPLAKELANVTKAKQLIAESLNWDIKGPQDCGATVKHLAHIWTLDEVHYRCSGRERK